MSSETEKINKDFAKFLNSKLIYTDKNDYSTKSNSKDIENSFETKIKNLIDISSDYLEELKALESAATFDKIAIIALLIKKFPLFAPSNIDLLLNMLLTAKPNMKNNLFDALKNSFLFLIGKRQHFTDKLLKNENSTDNFDFFSSVLSLIVKKYVVFISALKATPSSNSPEFLKIKSLDLLNSILHSNQTLNYSIFEALTKLLNSNDKKISKRAIFVISDQALKNPSAHDAIFCSIAKVIQKPDFNNKSQKLFNILTQIKKTSPTVSKNKDIEIKYVQIAKHLTQENSNFQNSQKLQLVLATESPDSDKIEQLKKLALSTSLSTALEALTSILNLYSKNKDVISEKELVEITLKRLWKFDFAVSKKREANLLIQQLLSQVSSENLKISLFKNLMALTLVDIDQIKSCHILHTANKISYSKIDLLKNFTQPEKMKIDSKKRVSKKSKIQENSAAWSECLISKHFNGQIASQSHAFLAQMKPKALKELESSLATSNLSSLVKLSNGHEISGVKLVGKKSNCKSNRSKNQPKKMKIQDNESEQESMDSEEFDQLYSNEYI